MAKIIMTTGIFPPDSGGPASYVPRMAFELTKRGHQVKIFTYSDSLHHDEDIKTYHYPVFRIRRRMPIILREFYAFFLLLKISKKQDIIYINGNDFKASLVGKILGIPRVHKIVGDYAWERLTNHGHYQGTVDEYQLEKSNGRFAFYNWHRSHPLKSARKIIVPSQYLKSLVSSWQISSDKIQVVYNSFEPHQEKIIAPELPPFTGKTVITICRLTAWKGVDDIIRAVAKIPHCRLLIVGDGPLESTLKKLVKDQNLAERVIFTGFVPKALIPSYLKQSDLFVLNSTYEGLPHVVLEAMYFKVPVIATDAGGTKELVINNQTGILIPPRNCQELTEKINLLLNNPQLASTLANNAEINLQHFSFTNMVTETESALTH